MEEIYYNKEGKDKLIIGMNKANDAVASTMGPNGATVIIPNIRLNKYVVTKDGVSVINSIKLKDPIENIGVELLREAANKTVEEAGDGTTTATVLTTAFVNNLKDFESKDINKAFDEIIPKVIEQLKLNSRELKHEDIKYVASISANNDIQIGELIQQAYNHTSIVKIEESDNIEDVLELVDGMSLPVSYFSKHFVTNESKGTVEFDNENVFILLLDGKLEKLETFKLQLQQAEVQDCSLVIMCEDIHEQVLRKLESFVLSTGVKIVVIKTPGYSKHRKDLLDDLANFTGATVIKDFTKQYTNGILGRLKSCKISKNNSVLVKHEDINIDSKILSLKEQLTSSDLTDYDKELLTQRIEKLEGKVSIIKVGGKTKNEMLERFDRYDDSIKAVACALEEGIVEGAGYALLEARYSSITTDPIILSICDSLCEPNWTISKNGCDLDEKYIKGHDIPRITYFEKNIIDPLKVTRCALLNAVATAKVILSTKAIVLQENEWKMN